ncbi:MAG: hypothetical protein HOA17_03230 [Candidatus Melainabacteria bacterium]|jgi:hypothetical protein|nr:hypothetical protein [Candidatus Melainabacteria bacterium]
MFKLLSPISVILVALGLMARKDPSKHVPLMLSAFAVDFILLIMIEFTDHAVEVVVEEVQNPDMNMFTIFHASISTVLLLLYFALIYTGFARLKDRTKFVQLHKMLAYAFIIFKLTNFITAFYVV